MRMSLTGTDESWKDQANCRGIDPELFFPARGEPTVEQRRVCAGCVVREECLQYALDNAEKFGIWGGMSERQRRSLRRKRPRPTQHWEVG
jgi:WhiB family redox-sensing transcriptional regulator